MKLLAVALLLAAVACASARLVPPEGDDPNRLQRCGPTNASSSSSDSSSSSSDSSSDSSDEYGNNGDGDPCPEVRREQCRSHALIRCGKCDTCLLYLQRGQRCRYPYPTNAECDPSLVCYTRGTCGDLVR